MNFPIRDVCEEMFPGICAGWIFLVKESGNSVGKKWEELAVKIKSSRMSDNSVIIVERFKYFDIL